MIQAIVFGIGILLGGIKSAQDHRNAPTVKAAREEIRLEVQSQRAFDRMIKTSERLSDGEK